MKNVIITGANSGLGLETAKKIANSGIEYRLILACRNVQKGEDAKKSIIAESGNENIVVWSSTRLLWIPYGVLRENMKKADTEKYMRFSATQVLAERTAVLPRTALTWFLKRITLDISC